MKKTMKKILCSLLVVVMCLTAAPLQGFVDFDWDWFDFSVRVSAINELAATGQCGDNVFWSYDISTGELYISGSGTMYDYESYYNDSPFYNTDIKFVIIDNGVTRICDYAFRYCEKLENITIPNSTISIGYGAFWGCKSLKSIVIPESVVNLGGSTFYDCSNLVDVTIGNRVQSIESSTFFCCISLKNITIGNNVKNIGNHAFCNCTNLESITIPNSVTNIGDDAFCACENLTNIDIGHGVTKIGDGAFYGCLKLKSVIIPNSTTMIDKHAFYNCTNLISVTMSYSVSTIGWYAFDKCIKLKNVYFVGTEEQWKNINIDTNNDYLINATINYNCKFPQDSYFTISSDTYSVDSLNRRETATYKINLLDENSDFLSIDDVRVQNNTTDIVAISTKKVSDTELELTVEPIKDGDASISLFNGDGSLEQFFNFTVYSNTTTYRADQVPVTNEKLKTNFSRGDMTVDNFEYIFDENKGKYIATMDVYNRSGAIGVVAAYTQDGLISDIEQVDPYVPLPGDFGEFLVYLGTGAVSILKGENWNYRYSGYCQKTPIEIEVPEDGYLTVSCDISADEAVLIYNTVSLGVKTAFKTAEIIDYLGTDTDELAKEASKTIVRKTSEYFKSKKGKDWVGKALSKISKKMSKQFSVAYLEEMSMLSFDMLEEICQNVGTDFSTLFFEVIDELIQEEIKSFGVMSVSKKLIKEKVIGVAERNLMKVASAIFEGGEYINFANELLGTYLYNTDTGKTMIVFKPKGEDGFICKDTIKVTSDIITDEVLLHTYVIKDTQKEDAFVRKTIYSDFNRGDGLRKEELSIDLNRIIEIHEISLWKNGQEVFDTFTATVEMNLPSYIDRRTCSIYRVEKDGTYTKLDTRIEGNKIIFETNHFSEYILTGVIEDLQETTPCDVHVYEEVRTEPSCTEEGSITYTCYCGDTYTETITANGHTDSEWIVDKDSTCSAEGSKHIECTVCEEVIKTGAIEKLPHNYSSVVTEATCETGGYTTYSCTCGDTYTGDKTPAKGHDYAEGVCKNCGDSKIDNCSCNCHKSGIMGIIWKILRFFYKLFKINPVCGCGVSHY